MTNGNRKFQQEFGQILEGSIDSEISPDIAWDALSIVLDAINSSINGLIVTDLDGNICFANHSFCKMFDYTYEMIVGTNAADLFTTRAIRTFADIQAMIDISDEDTQEFVVESSDSSRLVVEVSASDVTSRKGGTIGRVATFIDITRRKEIEAEREQLVTKLQEALEKIKTLKGIIPICASCKKIRDDKGYWNQLESYIEEHSEANFSHGICPDCVQKLYPGLMEKE